MKFSVEAQELNEALAVVSKALSPNAENQIMKGVFMSAFGNELYLKCSDSSVQIETLIPALVEEDGAAVLPGRLTVDLIRRMRGSRVNMETADSNSVKVEMGKSRSMLQYLDASTYPKMDDVRGDVSFKIKQRVFRSMIKQTVFSCSVEEGKAVLRGVLMEFTDDGLLNLIALDGFRLAKRSEKVSISGTARNAIVPARTMSDIANIISDTDDEVDITISATHITVDLGKTKVKARLIKGEYINYRNILSRKSNSRVIVDRAEFLKSLEVVWLIAKDLNNNVVRLDFDDGLMNMSARSEAGSVNESVEVNIIGTPTDIAFNAQYLMDIAKAVDDDTIALNFNTSVTPSIAEPVQGEAYYYLGLPIRLMRN